MTNRWLGLSGASLFLVLLLLLPTEGRANMATYSFYCITEDESPSIASQLSVNVSSLPGDEQVLFTFNNASGGTPSFISEIYFDDGTLLGIASLTQDTSKVYFVENVYDPKTGQWSIKPGDLPDGGTLIPPFEADREFTTQSDTNPLGVNPGESLGIIVNVEDGWQGVIDALAKGGSTDPLQDDLRIGLKVQGLSPNDASANFVNWPTYTDIDIYAVPLPGSILLGVFAVGWAGRKLRQFV